MTFRTEPEELVERGSEANGRVAADGGSGAGELTESGMKGSALAETEVWVEAPELCKPVG